MLTRRTALAVLSGAAGLPRLAKGNSPVTELPARLNRNHQILIAIKINNGAELWCLLDTGGSHLLYLPPAKAAELGIAPTSSAVSSGPLDTSSRSGGRAVVTMDAGALHRTSQELYIKEFLSRDDGVIGTAAFSEFIIELDFLAPRVRLHPPSSFRYQGAGLAIPFDLWSNNPQIITSLTIDDREPVKVRMTLDSGAAGIADAFLTPKFNDQLRRTGREIPWTPDRQGFSTSRVRRLAVGPFTMENPLIVLPPVQGFGGDANAPEGILAVNFLRNYRIYLDYAKKQAILEPNPPRAD
jgi:hypothetical protein